MKIIRDNDLGGIAMIPLFCDWNIRRCNQKGCRVIPTTIITQMGDDTPVFGLCEKHFQMCNVPGGATLNLEWDAFDAFKAERELPPAVEEET